MTRKFYIDDVGITLETTFLQEDGTPYAVNSSNLINFYIRKPDGSVLTKQGEYSTDGADGVVRYITVAGDLDQRGTWKYQSYIERGSVKLHSDIFPFRVLQPLA